MNAEQFLKRYREARLRIRKLEEQIQELDDLMSHITPEMSSDRVQSSHPPDKLGLLVARKVDLETQCMEEITRAFDTMNEIEYVIDLVEPVGYQRLLQKKYIKGETWERISEELYYSYQWIYVLHKRALAKVDKILASGVLCVHEQ